MVHRISVSVICVVGHRRNWRLHSGSAKAAGRRVNQVGAEGSPLVSFCSLEFAFSGAHQIVLTLSRTTLNNRVNAELFVKGARPANCTLSIALSDPDVW
jgi:hypothetical protein